MNEVVKLSPVVKSYIWGGQYFQAFKKGNGEEIISELWELSLRNDSSVISSGVDKGKLLNPGKIVSLKEPKILYINFITPKALSSPNKWDPVQISTKIHPIDHISKAVE